MYAREYPQNKSGTVRAFEDAFAKEEFLRRSAENATSGCTGKVLPSERPNGSACGQSAPPVISDCAPETAPPCDSDEKKPIKKECPLQKLFGFSDGGDVLLLLLIVFFLTDSDSENDRLIPILLAVLLFL